MELKAWVLVHDYYNDGGYTVHRVYLEQKRAEEDLDIAVQHDSGRWQLHEVPVIGEIPND